jgi:hypothetical protein
MTNLRTTFAASLLALAGTTARSDEGMWLLNAPPTAAIKAFYGFEPSAAWLLSMQRAAVRFQTGGSGSLVSASGLVMTNHHVGSDMLLKVSTKERDLLKEGFLARTHADEIRCPDLELNILWEIQDVTAAVTAGVKEGMSAAEAGTTRRKTIAEIEKASFDATKLKSEVVALFGGARYHLYRYKAYTDVRLVFAPEQSIAFFGGDTDNFEFPRYNLDCCFFRIYEDGKPLALPNHLRWSANGAAENELIFVFGHPGRTERLHTVEHLRVARDLEMPRRLADLWRREIKAQTFAGSSTENARIIRDELFGVANGRKAITGQFEGLLDPAVMNAKLAAETRLRNAVAADPAMKANWGEAWDDIAALKRAEQQIAVRRTVINRLAYASLLAGHAFTLTQLALELPKPSGERLREYGDAQLDSLYLGLYSTEPIYDALEIQSLMQALTWAAERLGAEDPLVAALLSGKSPTARAAELVSGTTLRDPAARKALATGGAKSLADSKDPLLAFASTLTPEWRAIRSKYEDSFESPLRDAYAKVAAAKFAVEGESVYPDATFTLRLSYGTVSGYTLGGESVPAFTQYDGLFVRHAERKGQDGFDLPARWLERKDAVNPVVPFNFLCSADIIGGNSGSPVVNAAGEVVGLVFDGNIHSLTGNFAYNPAANRAVAVDSRGMIEAFRAVYAADELVKELTTR